jgi:two-component system sensor histidine kinase CpxA
MIDFNEMADRIEDLLSAHKILLRDVSHELRSPLARLNVALELAREEAGAPNEALDRAGLESSRLSDLISELLSLSKMEIVHEIPQSQRIDLGDLVESLMPDLLFEAESRGCLLAHEEACTAQVDGSRDLLRRAIENVIRNAIRHSPPGQTVEIKTKSHFEQQSPIAIVEICDRGSGVPEKELQSIFRPFYRIDASRQSSTGGFGVGLAIADRAVQIHHGSICARNRPDGGLCVEIRLPCVLEPRALSSAIHSEVH